MTEPRWLLDTNVLLRFYGASATQNSNTHLAVTSLILDGAKLYYTSQILAEFWNVSTRPELVNGLGRSLAETHAAASLVEENLLLAADSEATHREWRRVVIFHQVSGAQVHDARIVATMHINGIVNLLTLNTKDFRRYPSIIARTPQQYLASLEE